MDDSAFDSLARHVGTRRGVVAGLAALLAGGPSLTEARRRRKCGPNRPCADGFACRDGRCACDSGVTCGSACCATGQSCLHGACAAPPEPACIPFGEACKNAGAPCCSGLACGSGQGGQGDIACHVPAGGACENTSDCVYGSSCLDGGCVATPEPGPAPTCDVVAGPDPLANGQALKAAIDAAPAGATVLIGGGDYEFRNNTGLPIITVDRDLTLAACGTGTPRVAAVEGAAAFRGTTIKLFLVSGGATLSIVGIAVSWTWTSNRDATAFGVAATGRVILEASTVQGFFRGIHATGSSRIELRGNVRITGSGQFGIDLQGPGNTPLPPDLSRIACSGAGNEVSGSQAINCLWYPSAPNQAICPTGCGCACTGSTACQAQVCAA